MSFLYNQFETQTNNGNRPPSTTASAPSTSASSPRTKRPWRHRRWGATASAATPSWPPGGTCPWSARSSTAGRTWRGACVRACVSYFVSLDTKDIVDVSCVHALMTPVPPPPHTHHTKTHTPIVTYRLFARVAEEEGHRVYRDDGCVSRYLHYLGASSSRHPSLPTLLHIQHVTFRVCVFFFVFFVFYIPCNPHQIIRG